MTIREFYEWAVEHGYEDFQLICGGGLERNVDLQEIDVHEQWKTVEV